MYEPFGQLITDTTQEPEEVFAKETKGFIGERYDEDSGPQYLNARYYDPDLAMFIQPDWFEVTRPGVGTNRYSYSFNDPVNLRDPGEKVTVKDGAELSDHAYQEQDEQLPDGFEVVGENELEKLGLSAQVFVDPKTGLNSRLYKNTKTGEYTIYTGFRRYNHND